MGDVSLNGVGRIEGKIEGIMSEGSGERRQAGKAGQLFQHGMV